MHQGVRLPPTPQGLPQENPHPHTLHSKLVIYKPAVMIETLHHLNWG